MTEQEILEFDPTKLQKLTHEELAAIKKDKDAWLEEQLKEAKEMHKKWGYNPDELDDPKYWVSLYNYIVEDEFEPTNDLVLKIAYMIKHKNVNTEEIYNMIDKFYLGKAYNIEGDYLEFMLKEYDKHYKNIK